MKQPILSLALSLYLSLALIAPPSSRAQGNDDATATTISSYLEKTVGEEVTFTLTARDRHGNIIRGWNTVGVDINLVVSNSGANTDNEPLTVTEIMDESRVLLAKSASNIFILPRTNFVDGQTRIIFRTTKADTGITITVTPSTGGLGTVGEVMNYRADSVKNFLVEVIPAKAPGTVYVMRSYEIRLTPRDRYGNINADESILARCTARYPGEFTSEGGGGTIFSGEIILQGPTNYYITSTQIRTNQEIICYSSADANLRGMSGPFTVAGHAPEPFGLVTPQDALEISLDRATDVIDFRWNRSNDPYTNVSVGTETRSDRVAYRFRVMTVDRRLLFDLPSNNLGSDTVLTITHAKGEDWMRRIEGIENPLKSTFIWTVEATDGLFTTGSQDEWKATFIRNLTGIQGAGPVSFTLFQNYPNPFSRSTIIRFELPSREFVTMEIYDMRGRRIATPVANVFDSGLHAILVTERELPAGSYAYRLVAGGSSIVRFMTRVR